MRWVPVAVVGVLGLSAVGAYFDVPSRFFDGRGETAFEARIAAAKDVADAAADAADDAADAARDAAEAAAEAAAVDWGDPALNEDSRTVFSLDTGEGSRNSMALNLPGGFGIKLPVGNRVEDGNRFEIDDVGPYPGATLAGMRVRVLPQDRRGDRSSQVELSFKAPAPPDTVLDWYADAFARKGTAFERRGDRILGRTSEDKLFELTASETAGGSSGLLRIRDED